MAIGVALLGPIIGQMILSPVISTVIEGSGWRTAWVVLAVVAFVCGLPAGLSAGDTAKTPAFWILMVGGAVLGLGFYAFNAHVVPYATDIGISTTAAALVLTVSSVGGAAGTLLAGAITARLGYRWTLLVLTALNGVAVFLFVGAGSVWAFYSLAVILGFAFSAVVPVRMGVVPTLFGLRAIGTIIGFTSLSFSLGAIAGPFVAGYIFDSTASYDLAFVIFGILLMIGAATLYFLRAPRVDPAPDPTAIWRAGDGLE